MPIDKIVVCFSDEGRFSLRYQGLMLVIPHALGVVECLQKEVSMFGINAVLFEPGFYRTKAFGNIKHETAHIPEYAGFNKAVLAYEAATYGNEPGDPKKAVDRMLDVVRGEGMATGKTMPLRLPLGSDGLAAVKDKCLATLKLCEEWEELITSTDIVAAE